MQKLMMISLPIILASICLYSQERNPEKDLESFLKNLSCLFQFQKTDSQAVLVSITQQLQNHFDKMLQQPAQYEKIAIAECRMFPEGMIYPFAFPALAYTNLALKDRQLLPHARLQMQKLIELLLPRIVQTVAPPQSDLKELKTYQEHGTYLGTLNLVLGCYDLIGGDARYREIHERVSQVLYQALQEQKGYPIRSYPRYAWNVDTIFALLSLKLHDYHHATDRVDPLIARHLQWLCQYGTDKATGLPYSIGWDGAPSGTIIPRGCDLSMRLCLLAQIAPDFARGMYQKYLKSHWLDNGFVAGFREWPAGSGFASYGDDDSGPVIFELGLTATGMGVGTTIAMKDQQRLSRLCHELTMVTQIKKAMSVLSPENSLATWFGDNIKFDDKYFTGFFYGDAVLFYAVTWTEYFGRHSSDD